jgi:hypothetical protein
MVWEDCLVLSLLEADPLVSDIVQVGLPSWRPTQLLSDIVQVGVLNLLEADLLLTDIVHVGVLSPHGGRPSCLRHNPGRCSQPPGGRPPRFR